LLLASIGMVSANVGVATAVDAAFPGDNGRISYTDFRDGQAEIFSMRPTGRRVVRLSNSAHDEYSATFSPNGRALVFVRKLHQAGEVFRMQPDGSSVRRLTNSRREDVNPAWAPGGRRILWEHKDRNDGWDLWVMHADGSHKLRLTNSPQAEPYPAWSPDGDRIAYTRGSGLYTIASDGSDHQERVVDWGWGRPSWSPDGDRLLIVGTNPAPSGWGIYLVDETGTKVSLVVNGSWWSPVFSPNGNRIAANLFDSTARLDPGIYTMDRDGTHRDLIHESPAGRAPRVDWQPR
jgi:Tol biopolymer transport system component